MGEFSSKKDGEPVWDQVTIDRLWATTQREAMIEAGPPDTSGGQSTGSTARKASAV